MSIIHEDWWKAWVLKVVHAFDYMVCVGVCIFYDLFGWWENVGERLSIRCQYFIFIFSSCCYNFGLRREPIGQICVRLKGIGFKLMKVTKFA